MTTFTPGKYRMANGEMAIVVCDVGENPFGGQSAIYPLLGYTADGYECWMRNGESCDGYDLVEPWTEKARTA